MTQNRYEKRKLITKEKIFNAALSLFLEKGFVETTVQEIVDKADVAKGTFFTHFPTKNAILIYLGEQRLNNMEEVLSESLQTAATSKDQLFAVFAVLSQMNTESKEITRLVMSQMVPIIQNPEMEAEQQNQEKLKLMFQGIIIEGKIKGEFRSNVDPSYAADLLVSLYFFTLFKWLREAGEGSLGAELQGKLEILLEGLNHGI